MSTWTFWTEAEKAIISTHYAAGLESEIMALLPGRTWRATQIQAGKLGIARMQIWSEAEEEIIRQHYTIVSKAQMLALLPNRPWKSIIVRAQRLTVPGPRRWTPAQLATLHEHFPAHGSAYVAALLGRSAGSVMKRATVLGIMRVWPRKAVRVHVPHPPKAAKAPKPPKAAKPPKAVAAPKPVKAPAPPKAAPLLAVKRSAGTPNLNLQKEARRKKEEAPKRSALITAEEIKKLPYQHPGRMAYMLKGQAGWQDWKSQQPAA